MYLGKTSDLYNLNSALYKIEFYIMRNSNILKTKICSPEQSWLLYQRFVVKSQVFKPGIKELR